MTIALNKWRGGKGRRRKVRGGGEVGEGEGWNDEKKLDMYSHIRKYLHAYASGPLPGAVKSFPFLC